MSSLYTSLGMQTLVPKVGSPFKYSYFLSLSASCVHVISSLIELCVISLQGVLLGVLLASSRIPNLLINSATLCPTFVELEKNLKCRHLLRCKLMVLCIGLIVVEFELV